MPTTEEKQRIYILRKELEKQSVVSWVRVYEEFPEIPRNQVRKIYFRELMKRGEHPSQQKPPTVSVQGVTPAYEEINEDDIWEQAVLKSRRVREINGRRHDQHITFSHGPVCLVFLADLHLGDTGVDYERLDDDIETIVETPGMYVVLVGDALNNFIVGRLKDIRMGAEFSISEEWVMVKRVLRKLAPKMIMSVSGNHDLWTFALTAVDYLEEIHARINPDILYSKYDNQVTVSVGEEAHVLRARHKWKGYSQYNPTHGVEWAAKFDKGRHFDIGIAAHTHVSGLYRQFNNGGKTGHAIICGSYKIFDWYAEDKGFPLANEAAAVALLIDENGSAVAGTNNLDSAASYMRAIYP